MRDYMNQLVSGKTVAILGSPHKHGTTAQMLAYAEELCKSRGEEVIHIDLYDKNIAFCRGCQKCFETEMCVMRNDDLQEIAEQIRACDRVILATPVYWANVPAAVKNMFDRLLGVAMKGTDRFPIPRLKGKRYIILTACDTPSPFHVICKQATGAVRAIKEVFRTAGMKCDGVMISAGKEKKLTLKMQRKIKRAVNRV